MVPAQQRPVAHVAKVTPPHAAGGPHLPLEHRLVPVQSLDIMHPQVPPGRQWGPSLALLQSTHAAPFAPQAPSVGPTHVPLPQQKAPPHVPSPPEPHAFVQALAVHVGVPPLQATHAPPPLPHAALSAVPSTHVEVAESQQPPLHGAPPAHEVEHA